MREMSFRHKFFFYLGVVVAALSLVAATAEVVGGQSGVPDLSREVQAVYDEGDFDLNRREENCRFRQVVAARLHAIDPNFGDLRKRVGQNQCPDGRAVDAILYRPTGQAIDIISSSESPDAKPSWQVDSPRYTAADFAVPASVPSGPVTPQPTPTPVPTPSPEILERLTAIQAALEGIKDNSPCPSAGPGVTPEQYAEVVRLLKAERQVILKGGWPVGTIKGTIGGVQ